VSMLLGTNGWTTTQLATTEASEGMLKGAETPKLLHIATHGFFYPQVQGDNTSLLGLQGGKAAQNPLLRSGLFLAGAGKVLSTSEAGTASNSASVTDNGIITAYEVMNMNLSNTELVVLSACETGLGEIRNGEGVYGLQRAFAVAGAKSVIMSLWRVNDNVTQEMISLFYQNWIQNKQDMHTAFEAAQNQVRKQFPEAYYWGAFVMVGN
jgi:CHAT domain-containing protein